MMHKAWCSIEEVPYCFPRPSIKFQGHKGQKIDDLDQIWARLLFRSQLSNPSDLPCFSISCEIALEWIPQKTFDDESTLAQLMVSAIRQQSITWASVDSDLSHPIESLGHNDAMYIIIISLDVCDKRTDIQYIQIKTTVCFLTHFIK